MQLFPLNDLGDKERLPIPEGMRLPKRPGAYVKKVFKNAPAVMSTIQESALMNTPEVQQARRDKLSIRELCKVIQGMPLFKILCDEITTWALGKAEEIGAASVSVGFEICPNPKTYGRCHYHTLFSVDVLDEPHPWAKPWVELVTCTVEQLIYKNSVPHLSTIYTKNGKGFHTLCRNGHYYCVGPKIGQLYCCGFTRGHPMEPFKERWGGGPAVQAPCYLVVLGFLFFRDEPSAYTVRQYITLLKAVGPKCSLGG